MDTRAVLDTNVVISGFLWHGPPTNVLMAAAKGQTRLFASAPLYDELPAVLQRPKLATRLVETGYSPQSLVTKYSGFVTTVRPVEFLEPPRLSDPRDVAVVATAYAANAAWIVSGDKHLLELGTFHDIRIVSTAEFLRRLNADPVP